MLETDRHECRDRKEDREHLVRDAPSPHREPDGEADEGVAEDAACERLADGEPALERGDLHRRRPDRSVAECGDVAPPRQQHGRKAADHVAHIDDGPVAEDRTRVDQTTRPCHRQQVVAGEELRPRDDDQDQAEAEAQPADQASDAEAKPRVGDDHREEQRGERNERPRENGEHQQRQAIGVGLRDADLFGLARDLAGRNGVDEVVHRERVSS